MTEVELASDLPFVVGHKGQLQEVVINLFQNAMEAMGAIKDGPRMLQLRTKRGGDDAVVIEIEDSGPGVDPADLNIIFDAWLRRNRTEWIWDCHCRIIIERHGGRLSASSDGTKWTLFEVILRTREPDADSARASADDIVRAK